MATLIKKLNESSVAARLVELILRMSDDQQRSLLKELEKRLSVKKRKHVRKPYFSVVDYGPQDVTYTDFIQNISAGGVFIGTGAPLSAGQELSISFPLPISGEPVNLTGEVVWVGDEGMGVKFKMASNQQETLIKSLVDMI